MRSVEKHQKLARVVAVQAQTHANATPTHRNACLIAVKNKMPTSAWPKMLQPEVRATRTQQQECIGIICVMYVVAGIVKILLCGAQATVTQACWKRNHKEEKSRSLRLDNGKAKLWRITNKN